MTIGIPHEEGLDTLHHEAECSKDERWAPYPTKIAFLLDSIDNMPRLRVSVGLMNVIIWLLREAGVKGVPTPTGFRAIQKSLREKKGVSTIHTKSPRGNMFSFNSPIDLIANVSSAIQVESQRVTCTHIFVGLDKPQHSKTHPSLSRDPRGWCRFRDMAWREMEA